MWNGIWGYTCSTLIVNGNGSEKADKSQFHSFENEWISELVNSLAKQLQEERLVAWSSVFTDQL